MLHVCLSIKEGWGMSFKSRINMLVVGILLTMVLLLGVMVGFSYYLVNKSSVAYQEGENLTITVDTAREAQVSFQRQVQEWKNTLIRGHDPKLYDKYFGSFQQKEQIMNDKLAQLSQSLQALGLSDTAQKADQLIADHNVLGEKYREALAAHPALDWQAQQAIDVMVRGIDRATSSGMDDLVSEIEANVTQQFATKNQNIKKQTFVTLLAVAIISTIITILLILLLIKMMRNLFEILGAEPERAVAATARIATGDLTEQLQAKSPNSLIGSLEIMQLRLRNISLAILASADELKAKALALSHHADRENMHAEIHKLYQAIGRIKTDRNAQD